MSAERDRSPKAHPSSLTLSDSGHPNPVDPRMFYPLLLSQFGAPLPPNLRV